MLNAAQPTMYLAFTAAFATPSPELPVSLGGTCRIFVHLVADLYRATASDSVKVLRDP